MTLLNGTHTILSPITYLSGIDIVRDACKDEVIGKYIRKAMYEELMQTLNLPEDELKAFAASVLERFENPFVDHQVTSIMLNAFPKFTARDLPSVKEYLSRKGELPYGIVLGLAALIVYYKGGKRADGAEIVPNDAPEIVEYVKNAWTLSDPHAVAEKVLAADFVWEENLNNIPGLTDMVADMLKGIEEKGMYEMVKEYVK